MSKTPVMKRALKKGGARRARPARLIYTAATFPTPRITSPLNLSTVLPGKTIKVHVTTNRPDLTSIVWLIDRPSESTGGDRVSGGSKNAAGATGPRRHSTRGRGSRKRCGQS